MYIQARSCGSGGKRGGGGGTSEPPRGSGGMLLQKILKISLSENAFPGF